MIDVDEAIRALVKQSRLRAPQVEDVVPLCKLIGGSDVRTLFELHEKALKLWKEQWNMEAGEY